MSFLKTIKRQEPGSGKSKTTIYETEIKPLFRIGPRLFRRFKCERRRLCKFFMWQRRS